MRPQWRVKRLARLATVAALGTILGTGWGAGPGPGPRPRRVARHQPANGAQLDAAPDQVRLRFSENVSVAEDGVVPRTPMLTVLTEPATPPEARRGPAPGAARICQTAWIVAWRVVSADSHPISGILVFSVGAAGWRRPTPTRRR